MYYILCERPACFPSHLIWGRREFLQELDTQTAGFTKCCFSVLAKRYIDRDGEVLHADISSPDPIDE
ncbi:hypothetical protein Har1130_19695 [Haloarcula sp. CBA1130]|nr:hypothetical protein Har1130_19695 [Haloarcula sp. CBA1130]KAA9398271.1 hypothetical protein Har1129_08610 [Haloarcula sp. CBA1129]